MLQMPAAATRYPCPLLWRATLLTLGVSRGSGSVEEFLTPYYIGHHTPLGNFVTAWAMKDAVVEWLGDEPPAPYAKM